MAWNASRWSKVARSVSILCRLRLHFALLGLACCSLGCFCARLVGIVFLAATQCLAVCSVFCRIREGSSILCFQATETHVAGADVRLCATVRFSGFLHSSRGRVHATLHAHFDKVRLAGHAAQAAQEKCLVRDRHVGDAGRSLMNDVLMGILVEETSFCRDSCMQLSSVVLTKIETRWHARLRVLQKTLVAHCALSHDSHVKLYMSCQSPIHLMA